MECTFQPLGLSTARLKSPVKRTQSKLIESVTGPASPPATQRTFGSAIGVAVLCMTL